MTARRSIAAPLTPICSKIRAWIKNLFTVKAAMMMGCGKGVVLNTLSNNEGGRGGKYRYLFPTDVHYSISPSTFHDHESRLTCGDAEDCEFMLSREPA